jgi:hypothetical protein
MEIFALLAEWDYEGSMLLGVFASEEEARAAVVTDRSTMFVDRYYIQRRVVGAPIDGDPVRIDI